MYRYLLLFIIFCVFVPCASSLDFSYPPWIGEGAEGDTSLFPTYVALTISENEPQQNVGYFYYPKLLPLWNSSTLQAASFNCSFRFNISVNDINNHGDGLAFVLRNSASPDVLTTSKGGFMGLFNASTNGTSVGVVAVEFDTFFNPDWDPNGNHIGIDINSLTSVKTQPILNFNLYNSEIFAWVDYSSSQSLLQVYATNTSNIKPTFPLLSHNINLTLVLPESVQVGFSAATGDSYEFHNIYTWNFSSTNIGITAAVPPSPPITKKNTNVGLFVGLGTGIFVSLAVIVLLGLRIRRRKQRRLDSPMPSGIYLSELPSGGYGPHEFHYKDLCEATQNFSDTFLLGQGGFGPVYKGMLAEDGSMVAVKCISKESTQGEKEFFAEVTIISRIRHKNLVQLKGWCRDKGKLLLVYEYLPNGSLDRYLFSKSSSNLTLDWRTRYNIVSGLGSALQYLHQDCEKVIVHRDIKASNVMLDTNYNAKLGDFGLARQLGEGVGGHTTVAAGTLGYMAPETYGTGRATPESDVYSYGIVLLEVACGRRPIDASLPTEFEGRLLDWVWDLHSKGRLIEASDSRLEGLFDEEEFVWTLTVGLACSHPDPKSRPSIRRALEALQGRAPLPAIPTFKPVAYYGPPLPVVSLFTTSTTSSCGPAISSSSSSALDTDLSEKALLHYSHTS